MNSVTIMLGLILIVDVVLVAQMIYDNHRPREQFRPLIDKDLILIEQKITSMEGRDFELLCGFIFEKLGYKSEVTPQECDNGRDIILSKDDVTFFVETKRWSETTWKVGREVCQKLVGSCIGENVKNGIVIAWGGYNSNAIEYVDNINKWKEFNLVLYDKKDVMRMIKQIGTTEVMKYLGFGYRYWNKNNLELVKNR